MALIGVAAPETLRAYVAVPGLSLSIGVLLLVFTFQQRRSLPAAQEMERVRRPIPGLIAAIEWGAVFVLVSVGLFWSAGDYSAAVGAGRGRDVEAALPAWPDAIVYSAQSLGLGLTVPGVREVPCTNPSGVYRFRYDGLKLVLQSGGQYFFLSANWTPGDGVAIVVPRSDSLRLEFVASRAAGVAREDSTC